MADNSDKEAKIEEIDGWIEKLERLKDNPDFKDYGTLLISATLTVDSQMTTCNDSAILMKMQGEKNGLKHAAGMVRKTLKDLRQRKESLIGKGEKTDEKEAESGY